MGHDIIDNHLKMHILVNLLKEYAVMTMQLYQVLGKKKLTVQKLHTQLKMFYTTLKKANSWGDMDTVLNVQNYMLKKSVKGKCSTCRKQGHKSADCWDMVYLAILLEDFMCAVKSDTEWLTAQRKVTKLI